MPVASKGTVITKVRDVIRQECELQDELSWLQHGSDPSVDVSSIGGPYEYPGVGRGRGEVWVGPSGRCNQLGTVLSTQRLDVQGSRVTLGGNLEECQCKSGSI